MHAGARPISGITTRSRNFHRPLADISVVNSHAADLLDSASYLCTWASWLLAARHPRAAHLIEQAADLLGERAKHLAAPAVEELMS